MNGGIYYCPIRLHSVDGKFYILYRAPYFGYRKLCVFHFTARVCHKNRSEQSNDKVQYTAARTAQVYAMCHPNLIRKTMAWNYTPL